MTLLINPVAPSQVQAGNRASPAVKTKGLADLSSIKPGRFTVAVWGFFCGDGRWEISKIEMTLGDNFGN